VFRFNRRRPASRGLVFYRLLELAAGHDPVRYRNIVAGKRPRKIPPTRQRRADTRRAWSGRQQSARGGPPTWTTPVTCRPPSIIWRSPVFRCGARLAYGWRIRIMGPPGMTITTRALDQRHW